MKSGALNVIAHATHEGLKIEYTPEERLDANIYLVSRAYDTLDAALWDGLFSDDMHAQLTEARELLGQTLERLAQERVTIRQGGST